MSNYRYTVTFSVDEYEAHDEDVTKFEELTRRSLVDVIEENWESANNIRCRLEDDYCIKVNNNTIPHFISKDAQALAEEKNEYYASAKIILNHLEVHGQLEANHANDITTALMTAVNCLLEKGGEKTREEAS